MDLLAFERKLDSTIMRKRLDIQEALKRPVKVYTLGNTFYYINLVSVFPMNLRYRGCFRRRFFVIQVAVLSR